MTTRIINRGRGPEIEETRITVYRIMDFVRDHSGMTTIAEELDLSEAQVQAALDYIAANRADVEATYDQLLQRVQQANPPHIQAGRAQSLDALKRRIHVIVCKTSTMLLLTDNDVIGAVESCDSSRSPEWVDMTATLRCDSLR